MGSDPIYLSRRRRAGARPGGWRGGSSCGAGGIGRVTGSPGGRVSDSPPWLGLAPVAVLAPLAGDELVGRLVAASLDADAPALAGDREGKAGQPGRQAWRE